MNKPKSPHFEAVHCRVGGLLLLWLATACGDQKAASDTSGAGGGPGAHAGGMNGNPGGGRASAGATSGGVGGAGVAGIGAAGSGGTRAGASGAAQGGAGSGRGGAAGKAGAGGSAAGGAGAGAGGGTGGSPNGGTSQGGAPAATLAAVQAIFDDRCVNCHDASKGGLPTYPMLPLTAGASHAALVNVPADETCGGVRVVPGDPDASYLVKKLEQATPCDGQHMPRPFEVGMAPPLTADQLATIRAWIAAGAPN